MEQRFNQSFKEKTKDKILRFIKTGNSISILGIPGSGKSQLISYLLDEINKDKSGTIGLKIDVNDLVNVTEIDFFKYLLYEILDKIQNQPNLSLSSQKLIEMIQNNTGSNDTFVIYRAAKQTLDILKRETDCSIGIFIDGFKKLSALPTSFFNSLRAFRATDKKNISFIFTDNINITNAYTREKIGDLYDLITNYVIWLPLRTKEDTYAIIEEESQVLEKKLTDKQKEFVWKMSNGNPSLTKYIALALNEMPNEIPEAAELIRNSAIKSRIEKIVSALTEEEIDVLTQIANGKKKENELTGSTDTVISLKEYQILTEDGKDLAIFSPLVEVYLAKNKLSTRQNQQNRSQQATIKSSIRIKDGIVYIGKETVDKDLTKKELEILDLLSKNPGKVISREQIAVIMWGKDFATKYSDWAIDRTISRVRSKIGDFAYKPKYIKTLRGRGFKLLI